MAIKDLAVAYNGSTNARAAIVFACQMGRKYGAAITGLHVRAPVQLDPQVRRWTPTSVLEGLEKAAEESVAAIEASFRETVAAEGFEGPVEWVVEEGPVNDHLAALGRYHDLLVIGQFSEPEDKRVRVRVEDLVQRLGGPLIVVPNGYTVRPFSEYAAVAWDGSRAAARALRDAMQILETKARLDVVRVRAEPKAKEEEAPAGRDLIRLLEGHGIEARRVALTAPRDKVGQAILGYCDEQQPDVLVMGAYGHARLREELFGGVTRHILRYMTVPVLMSH